MFLKEKWYLCDFGVSKVIASENQELNDNEIVGTPNYMSPELFYNYKINNISKSKYVNWFKNDIFSLGLTLLHAITLKDVSNLNACSC